MKALHSKTKKIVTVGLCLLLLLGITGCEGKNEGAEVSEEKQEDTLILKDVLEFEINSELSLLSLLSEDNTVTVVSADEPIDTSVLGEKEITIKYKTGETEEEKTFTITITDTQAPVIECKKELTTTAGTTIDLLADVTVSDNSKEKIAATVEGEYDLNTEGTYTLTYVAVDSSDNKTEEEFTLTVNKPACTHTSGSWTTTKPDSSCEYTAKTITWYWQWSMDEDGNERTDWTVEVNYQGFVGWAYVDEVGADYDVYPYLSTKPTETYDDDGEHYKEVTVYIHN